MVTSPLFGEYFNALPMTLIMHNLGVVDLNILFHAPQYDYMPKAVFLH